MEFVLKMQKNRPSKNKTLLFFLFFPDDWVINMDAIDDSMYEKYTKRSKVDDEQLNKLAGKYRRQTI